MNLKEFLKTNHNIKFNSERQQKRAQFNNSNSMKSSRNKPLNKDSKNVFDLKFGCLANMFYATLTIIFHVISLVITVRRIRTLMQTLMLNLSLSITEKLSNLADIEQSNQLLRTSLSNSKFFITNQFASAITLVVFSSLFLVGFVLSSLFNTGNLANDSLQLGDDLVIVEQTKCQKEKKSSYVPKSEVTLLNMSLSSGSSPLEITTSESSSSAYSSSSSFNSGRGSPPTIATSQTHKINQTLSTLTRVFFLPPFNCMLHLAMCLCVNLVKLDLDKFQLSYDIDKSSTHNTLLSSNLSLINSNETKLTMLSMLAQLKQLDQIFLHNLTPTDIDLNYINYIFGFIVLGYKMTRVYSNINRLYGILVFVQVILFTILNLTTLSAFRVLYETSGIRYLSTRINQSSLKNLINSDSLYTRNSSVLFHPNHSVFAAVFLESDHLLLTTFFTSWILNLLYLGSLNFFGFSFFSQAQLKIRHKYEQCLSQFIANKNSYSGNKFKTIARCGKSGLQIEYRPVLSKIGVQNQYKAILAGIVLLLAIEIFQIPFIYTFYMSYMYRNLEIYLMALCAQLVYLLANALFWILLSFKPDWTVRFTANYRVLYWNRMFTEYIHAQNSKKMITGRRTNCLHKRSKSVESFLRPKLPKNHPKLPTRKQPKQLGRDAFHMPQTCSENYFLTEISRLPNYYQSQAFEANKYVAPSATQHSKSYTLEQNQHDSHLTDVSDLNAEDELEMKVKLNNGSSNKNNTISYVRQSDFESIDSPGREYWTASRNREVTFDKKKLFSILLENNKANKRGDFSTINF